MSNLRGLNVLLYIGDTAVSPTVYSLLEGQTNTTFDGTTNAADTTDKGNDGWQTALSTTRSGTVSVEGNLKDAANRTQIDALEAAWRAGTEVDGKILVDVDYGYAGQFYVTAFNLTGDVNDVVKYSMTLTPSAGLVKVTS